MPPIPSADDPGSPTGGNPFPKAQEGCRHSLNSLMAAHDGLVQAVVRQPRYFA